MERYLFCDKCPKKRQRDIYKRQTEEYCQVKLGNRAKKYSFAHLENLVYQVGSLLDLSAERLSVRAGVLVDIYRTERKRNELKTS